MKLISLLIALLIIGFLVNKQLNSSSSLKEHDDISDNKNISTPKVPTSPKDVKKFEKEMNDFMQDAAAQKAKRMEDALNQ